MYSKDPGLCIWYIISMTMCYTHKNWSKWVARQRAFSAGLIVSELIDISLKWVSLAMFLYEVRCARLGEYFWMIEFNKRYACACNSALGWLEWFAGEVYSGRVVRRAALKLKSLSCAKNSFGLCRVGCTLCRRALWCSSGCHGYNVAFRSCASH